MLNVHASFASFVVGSSNRLAATAAKAVAEAPGAMYNPLFIYARPGLGKTHLLMAIGNEAKRFAPTRTVEYVTVDDFVEAYQAALAAGQADAYRRRFTEADLVLLDDAQLLADRRELQSELLRLIDILAAADRQIVLAGDRPPEEIQQLDERLIRRFAGGLIIDIGAPDYETRLAIIARRAGERQTTFIPAVLDAVAQLPITTVRELLGALNRLIAQQAVQAEPLTAEQAHQVLEALGHRPESDLGPGYAPEVRATVRDEFTDFLSDLTVSVAQRVDRWRQLLTEATLRWGGEGFRTTRLDTLLAGDLTEDPAETLFAYEQNIVRLRELHDELEGFAPELLSESTLHDPDRIEEAERFVVDAREAGPPLAGPLPRFTLDTFTAGPSTRPAVEAIRSAAASPGQRYNPLVIVGRPGSGKSHLLHAFGHALRAGGLPRVAVLDGRQFVSDLVEALGAGQITRWRQRLRRVDAFLLDDVGALSGKERSQEELYLLYNLLLESGRQMAFTSVTTPTAMSGFEARLATRLSGGLVVELGLPDREAKLREVERLLGAAAVDPELVDYLSSRPASSLREVQQLVTRLVQAADQRAVTLSLPVVRQILEGDREESPRPARRGSGLLSPGNGALRSREKMIETWPDVAERIIEDRV